MHNLRAAAPRTLTSKPSLPSMSSLSKDPATPKSVTRKPSFHETSPQTSLLKARYPGENVIASTARSANPALKSNPPIKKTVKQTPPPNESQKRESAPSNPSKSSAALRDTIAKAKAARREEIRKSGVGLAADPRLSENEIQAFDPVLALGVQSLKKKLEGAVTSGVLNLSAMGLKGLPDEVSTMYDFREDSAVVWSEAVDLKKLLLADNEIETLSDTTFPDWSKEQMLADPEKSNQFGGLEVLDMHGNMLKTLPVGLRQLSNLRVLNISANHLSADVISIASRLGNLRELRIAKNGMKGCLPTDICQLRELQILDLSDNQFDGIPSSFSQLHNLQKLFLAGNKFSSIPLNVVPSQNLIEMNLSGNMLKDALAPDELQNFDKLQSLDVSMNSLGKLCIGKLELPSLQTLAVHSNRLIELPDLSACTQMTTLVASGNCLTELPEGLTILENIRNVDLSGNNIKHIGPELTAMPSLVAFNVASNPLREKKYLTMNVDEIKLDLARKSAALVEAKQKSTPVGAASEHTSEDTDTASAKLDVFTPKAGVLDVSSQNLSSLVPSQVDLSGKVHTIRMANNDLTAFPVELLQHPSIRWSLRSLDISHNPGIHPTEYLQEELHLPLLQSLYVVSTGLTTLDTLTTYLKAPELKELNISCHRLTGHIPWVRAWYPAMTTLLASDNWFESIDVEAVRGLEVLDIRNNEIDHLPPKIGLLGNHANKIESGRLRSFECSGNKFRVPRLRVIERGTEAILKDLRRMIPAGQAPEEWMNEI